MKRLLLLLLFTLAGSAPLRAQTFEEWFRQKKTQKKYLVQQIAALRAYAGTLREGYALLDEGLSTVQHIRNGDLGLHQDFFSSLQAVNPQLPALAAVADILGWQAAILRDFRESLRLLRQAGLLTEAELGHIAQVQNRVLQACVAEAAALRLLLSPGRLALSDAERLQQLTGIHHRMREAFGFSRAFLEEARLLSLQRAGARREAASLHQLYPTN